MLDFHNKDGPVIQSRPSSIYEKRRIHSPTKNEPIYEPVLPPLPPPLPRKPWENNIKDIEAIQNGTESYAFSTRLKDNKEHRGPAPLQRSPVIDNVALKALSEGHNLKIKEVCLTEDIHEQLSSISTPTKQHMSERGTLQDCSDEEDRMLKSMNKQQIVQIEKLHTLKYKSAVLSASDQRMVGILDKDCSPTLLIHSDGSGSEIKAKKGGGANHILTAHEEAQAQQIFKGDGSDATLHEDCVQRNQNTVDSYTQVLKMSEDEPLGGAQFEIGTITCPRAMTVKGEEKGDHLVNAIEIMSSEGQGLPYIDEPRESDTSDSSLSDSRQLWANITVQRQTLPSVEEEQSGTIFL